MPHVFRRPWDYRRRRQLPTIEQGVGPPAGPPPVLRPKRPLQRREVVRRPDYALLRRLNERRYPTIEQGVGPPAGPPPNLRPKRLLQSHELVRRPDHELLRLLNQRRPTTVAQDVGPPAGPQVKRPKRLLQNHEIVRRPDYERLRQLNERRLPPVVFVPVPGPTLYMPVRPQHRVFLRRFHYRRPIHLYRRFPPAGLVFPVGKGHPDSHGLYHHAHGIYTHAETLVYCKVRKIAAQSILNGVFTEVLWDFDADDPFDMHSITVNPGQIIVPVSGVYALHVQISWANNATGGRDVILQKLPPFELSRAITLGASAAGLAYMQELYKQTELGAGQAVRVLVQQTISGGGALDLQASNERVAFSLHRLGDIT